MVLSEPPPRESRYGSPLKLSTVDWPAADGRRGKLCRMDARSAPAARCWSRRTWGQTGNRRPL